ncbi:MAG: response regulator [bacterium]|nr:response regulator [bacterium]
MSQPPRFLIVDDNTINRSLLEHLLRGYGECFFAVDGFDAINQFTELYQQGKPADVIFLDVMMPGMTGNQVLEKIRDWEMQQQVEKGVEVVMVSALRDGPDIQASLEAGARHYLTKPYKETTVYRLLDQMGFEPQKTA